MLTLRFFLVFGKKFVCSSIFFCLVESTTIELFFWRIFHKKNSDSAVLLEFLFFINCPSLKSAQFNNLNKKLPADFAD